MAVARSFLGGVVIRYVLPVLWMTTCFHRKALWRVTPRFQPTFSSTQQVPIVTSTAGGAKSAVYVCLVCSAVISRYVHMHNNHGVVILFI